VTPCLFQCPPAQRGQALVEFAISSTFLLLLLAGAIDFGMSYADRLEVANAARVGARWASLHSGDVKHGWANVSNPAENTIPGQVLYAGDTRQLLNDRNHLIIQYYYWTQGSATTTACGKYDQSLDNGTTNDGFVSVNGYTESQCIAVGNVAQVIVNYDYPVLTPIFATFFSPTISVQSRASFVIQS
jgi:Flp pilus assembly protein TadG